MLYVYNYMYSDLAESVAAFFYCGVIENFRQTEHSQFFLAIVIGYFNVKKTIIINKLIIRLKAR